MAQNRFLFHPQGVFLCNYLSRSFQSWYIHIVRQGTRSLHEIFNPFPSGSLPAKMCELCSLEISPYSMRNKTFHSVKSVSNQIEWKNELFSQLSHNGYEDGNIFWSGWGGAEGNGCWESVWCSGKSLLLRTPSGLKCPFL